MKNTQNHVQKWSPSIKKYDQNDCKMDILNQQAPEILRTYQNHLKLLEGKKLEIATHVC